MGVSGGGDVLHQVPGLKLEHLANACLARAQQNSRSSVTAVVDASWIGFRATSLPPALFTVAVLEALVSAGFVCHVIFDPAHRHHTKCASIERCGKREESRLAAFSAKQSVMRIANELRTLSLTEAQRKEKVEEQKTLQSTIQKGDNALQSLLPSNFVEDLHSEVEDHFGNRADSVFLSTGAFQADSAIAKLILDGMADIVFANDADFSFLCGGQCLQVHEFKLDNKTDCLKDITVKSASLQTVTAVVNASADLGVEKIKKAKVPLLDGVEDPRFRMAIGLALGCDVLVGGIRGMGAASIQKLIVNNNLSTADALLEKLSALKDCDLSVAELGVLLDSWFYEPAAVTKDGKKVYMFSAPSQPVDTFLAEFANPSLGAKTAVEGVKVITCHGHAGQSPHMFLERLSLKCSQCRNAVCGFCCAGFSPSKRTQKNQTWSCLQCLCPDTPDESIPADEMKQTIIDRGLQVPSDINFADLQELYEAVIEGGACDRKHSVKYLCRSAVALQTTEQRHEFLEASPTPIGQWQHSNLLSLQRILTLVE